MRIDKQFIEDAYRKLKGSVYLDKTVPFIRIGLSEKRFWHDNRL